MDDAAAEIIVSPLVPFHDALCDAIHLADALWMAPRRGLGESERTAILERLDSVHAAIRDQAKEAEPVLATSDGTPPRQWLLALLEELESLVAELLSRAYPQFDEQLPPIADDEYPPLLRMVQKREGHIRRLNSLVPQYADAESLRRWAEHRRKIRQQLVPDSDVLGLGQNNDCWSSARSPKTWCRVFGEPGHAISLETLHRRIESGVIRVKKIGIKSWQVHLDCLPAGDPEARKSPQ